MQQVIWLIKHKADTELQKDVSIDQRVKLLDVVKEKVDLKDSLYILQLWCYILVGNK